ncbi:MAG TPA: DUF6174 domain-containing protein, partial [Gemmatimonadaceae bacterium]
ALCLSGAAASAQTLLGATDPVSRATLRDSLTQARERWKSTRPLGYRAQIEMRCECVRPRDNAPWVLVRGDSILLDSVPADQRALVVNRPEFYTIDRLFTVLETAVADTLVSLADVKFDSRTGIPLSFTTRHRCVSRVCSTGGWVEVRVFSFEVVASPRAP